MLQRNEVPVSSFTPEIFDSFDNLADVFVHTATAWPDRVAYSQANLNEASADQDIEQREWVDTHYNVSLQRVNKIAAYLEAIGVEKGDKVAILSNTRPEWSEVEVAIYSVGATAVTAYTSDPAERNGYVLYDSGAKVVFAENSEQAAKIQDVMQNPIELPETETHKGGKAKVDVDKIITFEDSGVEVGPKVETLSRILNNTAIEGVDLSQGPHLAEPAGPDDVATVVYTSGTTGAPKGVVATHRAHLANLKQIFANGFLKVTDKLMHVLPFAHAFGMRMGHMTLLTPAEGKFPAVVDNESSQLTPKVGKSMVADIGTAGADYLPAVPRLLQRFKDGIEAKLEAAGGLKAKLGKGVLNAYSKRAEAELTGEKQSFGNKVSCFLYDKTGLGKKVKAQIKDGLVGPDFKAFVSGGAALPKDLAYFFEGIGLPIYEGYGATETNTPVALNTPTARRAGSVGQILNDDIEVKIDEHGEILVKSPSMASEYLGYEDATAKTFDSDGWYHTRDRGRIDEDGFLYIEGRADDIEVPVTGENINAVDVEEKLKSVPIVGEVVFHAHKRPFPIALVAVNPEELSKLAPNLDANVDLLESEEARKLVQEQIDKVFNKSLARPFERVKGVLLIPEPTIGNGLTPSFKVQRKKLVA